MRAFGSGPARVAVALAVTVIAVAPAARARIPLELRFDAVQIIRDALARYGDSVRADQLRRTLARFEREGAR